MNYYSIFIVVVLILAISHQGQSAETPVIDFFQKLEELAHNMAKKALELAKPVATALKG
ncbi:andropin-like [Drosophila subpulchrella]|uniref:andropin-like n=1 Tax=Drosophila subpulchrella TaxID=1486046 RepID=UPI0018A191C8|nr:andropin-like [Drosophila subpulchrella]